MGPLKRAAVVVTGFVLSMVATPLVGQQAPSPEQWFRRGTVMLGFEVGGVAFSDFQRTMARPLTNAAETGDFERRVSASTSGTAAGWAALWLSSRIGIRAGASYAPSALTVRNDQLAQGTLAFDNDPERQYAGLDVLLADMSLMVRFPMALGRVVPYGMAGGGVVRYWPSSDGELPPEAQRFERGSWTGAAGMLGLGATIQLEKRNLMLVFELTDHITRTPLRSPALRESVDVSGVPLLLDPAVGSEADEVDLVNNVRLMVGVALPIR